MQDKELPLLSPASDDSLLQSFAWLAQVHPNIYVALCTAGWAFLVKPASPTALR